MSCGFVYLLANKAMPCYFKIGCTERAPHQRAEELSRSTSVPHPFQMLLYIEVSDCLGTEQHFHRQLSDFRASTEREFFCFRPSHMNWLRRIFKTYPFGLAYSECEFYEYAPHEAEEFLEPWVYDPDAEYFLEMPDTPPIGRGELRLVA